MDTEKSGEVLGASETPQQEETAVEKEAVETPVESTEPEKSPAAEETTGQMAVNGHQSEAINVKETEELIGTMPEENDPAEKSDADSVPGAKALQQPEESSEKKISEQQPVPENDPESLALQTPLAESAPEPEPAKAAESVPEIKGQTLPESAVVQPPGPTEKEQAKTEKDVQKMDTGAEGDASAKPKEKEEAKPEETVVESEKTAEAQMVMAEASAEVENVKPESEEDVVPAAGSLSFAFLEQEQTKDALRISRTLLVLRGLPGSGKSFLARAIADTYKDHCIVISADDYGIKPEKPESCADGYKALDEAVVARCTDGNASPVLVVVDDTHHTQDRLARLGEIAEQQDLVALFLEPQTEWRRDLALLTKKTKRGLEEAHLAAMKGPLEEVSIPLYFGWFLLFSVKNKIKCTSMDFLKTLDTLDAFKKHSVDFTGKAEKEVDLEQYFKPAGILHCTTKFCDYGKAEGAKEYAENQAVIKSYGSISDLSLGAFFVTPRTCGARVSLTDEQLQLWPADAEKQAEPVPEAAASLPLGSRAHITLGCAEGVEPVQTGIDLLEILAQQASQQGELVEEMELGSLTYYGEGKWLLNLREPICVPACFSSMYGRKEPEPTKKDPEKKKKPKCAIL
ncbi:2',3'-cyclic-nucleotide 3'-phosphodiesterase [Archocentrus centrarchus]|uniref:2',3'-cyclic-nucleotide 3'-phosphodiesterase n=1 Tax=Archocentrus centrarchus TaxID=63155 RepID=UPI0011EA4DEF|nr:2',3'-cyclic-nucleotide 3'-phosphodiesterase [Archocentrus centrarchus]